MRVLLFALGLPLVCGLLGGAARAANKFQPYSAAGHNLVHIATADLDSTGKKDHVVAMDVDGVVIAFENPADIVDPADGLSNILWTYSSGLPSWGMSIQTGEVDGGSAGDEILLPGTDGHLRVLSASGALLVDVDVSEGALWAADVGVDDDGEVRIVTSGVDGKIYILDSEGALEHTYEPDKAGVAYSAVVGNYDGVGGDEVISIVYHKNFNGHTFMYAIDLTTYVAPSYWEATAGLDTAALPTQYPHAYDMDGDGDDEYVEKWGVSHPDRGTLSNGMTWSEFLDATETTRIRLSNLRDDFGEAPGTGYVYKHTLPGDFIIPTNNDATNYLDSEVFLTWGDDNYLIDYQEDGGSESVEGMAYGLAPHIFHFCDADQLEGNGQDKVVLAGPASGDDHFYVVDLSGDGWNSDITTIDEAPGRYKTVSETLESLGDDLEAFSGVPATAGEEPIWFINSFGAGRPGGVTDSNMHTKVAAVKAKYEQWNEKLFGDPDYWPQRIRYATTMAMQGVVSTPEDHQVIIDYFKALAAEKLYFSVMMGKGGNLYVDEDYMADYFAASINEEDGECYMIGFTGEIAEGDEHREWIDMLDAVKAKADELGVDPPVLVLRSKGSTELNAPELFRDDGKYSDMLSIGVELSNTGSLGLSAASRLGLWLNGDIRAWSSDTIGDTNSPNKVMKWFGMTHPHTTFRHMLSQYALGARVFRITSIASEDNPLYLSGDVTDPSEQYSRVYRDGIYNFLRIVEYGVFPNSPRPNQMKGLSPVAVAIPSPDEDWVKTEEFKHDWDKYDDKRQTEPWAMHEMACWAGFVDYPSYDFSAVAYNEVRRFDNLLSATSPGGFIPIVAHESVSEVESNNWCDVALETDGVEWADYPPSDYGDDREVALETAVDAIEIELLSQRSNLKFYVDGDPCFWQVTQDADSNKLMFAMLMDSDTLTPTAATATLKVGSATGYWEVFDQLGAQNAPLGVLDSEVSGSGVTIDIPAGAARFLTIRKRPLYFTEDSFAEPAALAGVFYDGSIADRVWNPTNYANVTFSLVSGPLWLTVDADGTLGGTPGAADVGINTFIVKVSCADWEYEATMSITVNHHAEFTSDPIVASDALFNTAYDGSLADFVSSSIALSDLTFSKVSGQISNDWLEVAEDGTLSGTPTAAGRLDWIVRMEHSSISPVDATLRITTGHNASLTSDPADATWNTPYTDNLSNYVVSSVGTQGMTFSKLSGPSSDDWLTIEDNGSLSGTPATTGEQQWTVTMSHPSLGAVDATFSIYVEDNWYFTSDPFSESGAVWNVPFSGSIADDVAASNPTLSLSFYKDSGPDWLDVGTDGSLSGTPDDSGMQSFTVRVYHAGINKTATLNIDVAPTVSFGADSYLEGSVMYNTRFSGCLADTVSAPPSAQVTFSKVSGPDWLIVNTDGSYSGTGPPTAIGVNTFTVMATTGTSSDTATFAVEILSTTDSSEDPFHAGSVMPGSSFSADISNAVTYTGSGTLTFAKTPGPSWVTVSTSGSVIGTPAAGDVGVNQIIQVAVFDSEVSANATMEIDVETVVASDDFETDNWRGGSGWNGNWDDTNTVGNLSTASVRYNSALDFHYANVYGYEGVQIQRELSSEVTDGTLSFTYRFANLGGTPMLRVSWKYITAARGSSLSRRLPIT